MSRFQHRSRAKCPCFTCLKVKQVHGGRYEYSSFIKQFRGRNKVWRDLAEAYAKIRQMRKWEFAPFEQLDGAFSAWADSDNAKAHQWAWGDSFASLVADTLHSHQQRTSSQETASALARALNNGLVCSCGVQQQGYLDNPEYAKKLAGVLEAYSTCKDNDEHWAALEALHDLYCGGQDCGQRAYAEAPELFIRLDNLMFKIHSYSVYDLLDELTEHISSLDELATMPPEKSKAIIVAHRRLFHGVNQYFDALEDIANGIDNESDTLEHSVVREWFDELRESKKDKLPPACCSKCGGNLVVFKGASNEVYAESKAS